MNVNQRGEEVEETVLSPYWGDMTGDEAKTLLMLLLDRLGLEAVRTNATKHGATEVILRKIAD